MSRGGAEYFGQATAVSFCSIASAFKIDRQASVVAEERCWRDDRVAGGSLCVAPACPSCDHSTGFDWVDVVSHVD